eukprot:scpid37762/ scgid11160/ 
MPAPTNDLLSCQHRLTARCHVNSDLQPVCIMQVMRLSPVLCRVLAVLRILRSAWAFIGCFCLKQDLHGPSLVCDGVSLTRCQLQLSSSTITGMDACPLLMHADKSIYVWLV